MTLRNKTILALGIGISISTLYTGVANANEITKEAFYVSGVAANDALNIRNWETNEVIAKVKNGESVTKIKDLQWKPGWALVKTSNGVTGICNTKYLNKQKAVNSSINLKTINKDIELRKGAGMSYSIYKRVKAGTEVELISIKGDWATVIYEGFRLHCPKYYIKDFNKTSNSVNINSNSSNSNINTTNVDTNKNKLCVSTASVTTSKSSYASVQNAKTALKKLDGYTVNPGQTFSFYGAIGKVHKDFGFVESSVIRDGVMSTGIGGGICLASTTVFNAMIDAGIEPLERRNHSIASSYVERGLDAMVASGSSDLKFVNKTGKKLTFTTSVRNGYATVTITSVGDHKNGCTYEPDVELSNNKLTAKTYMKVFKNGKLIDRKLITTSNYRK